MDKMEYFKYTEKEINYLKEKDPKLKEAIKIIGPIKRIITPDLFTAVVYTIIGQQISTKAADTVRNRFKEYYKEIIPKTISKSTPEEIQKIGVSQRKANYIYNASLKFKKNEINYNNFNDMNDEEVLNELIKLDGIGMWSANMIMMLSMNRMNIISYGDFALKRGIERLYNIDNLSLDEFNYYKNLYSPYASVASLYLWEIAHK